MKLLIFTQKVDQKDSVLGFFHGWLYEISKKAEKVYVICLEKGDTDLPSNVSVFSLGKEKGGSRFLYVKNLYKYLKEIDGLYDKVLVHMNQEYILLAGLYWKFKNIPVYMWRNHPDGNFLTSIAVALSTKVFCTSSQSYTASFPKTIVMPAGIDTEMFKPVMNCVRKKYSVCMVGRIAPIKNNLLAVIAMKELVTSGAQVSLTLVGSHLDKDKEYFESVKEYVFDNGLSSHVSFSAGVEPSKLSEVYSSHEICLNLTKSGSFDKTIVESAACGAIPVVSNFSLAGLLPASCITSSDPKEIAETVLRMLLPHERINVQKDLEIFVESQSLKNMLTKLFKEIN